MEKSKANLKKGKPFSKKEDRFQKSRRFFWPDATAPLGGPEYTTD